MSIRWQSIMAAPAAGVRKPAKPAEKTKNVAGSAAVFPQDNRLRHRRGSAPNQSPVHVRTLSDRGRSESSFPAKKVNASRLSLSIK